MVAAAPHIGGGQSGGEEKGHEQRCSALNKNVLEIVLDKDQRGSINVSDHDCARAKRKIGLDTRSEYMLKLYKAVQRAEV